MVSTIPSGSGTHICTKTHNTLVPPQKPPMEEHSVLGWGEPFLGEEGADRERKRLSVVLFFCCLICFKTCLTLRDWLWRKAWLCFGKHPRIFWQSHSQLQGQTVVCVSLSGCVSLMPWRCDGRWGQPWALHQCWVMRTHLFLYFQGNWLWNRGGGNREVFFCWGLHVIVVLLVSSGRTPTMPAFQ